MHGTAELGFAIERLKHAIRTGDIVAAGQLADEVDEWAAEVIRSLYEVHRRDDKCAGVQSG